jgi:hypothetical protein
MKYIGCSEGMAGCTMTVKQPQQALQMTNEIDQEIELHYQRYPLSIFGCNS